ncbi:MAG: hypothetical protein M0C28_41135 [Candidatus Moduliflexus flocculans]|nr:hypothetical protein [Candidatus Moduliflexus flocculans]
MRPPRARPGRRTPGPRGSARVTTWLNKIAGVRPEEGRRTLLAALFYFFFVAQVVMVKSASNALFLSRHNPQHLPYLYIGVALAVAIAVAFASRTLADPRRRSLRLWSLGAVALIQLGLLVLLRVRPRCRSAPSCTCSARWPPRR